MQIYLLATTLFAIAALLLATGGNISLQRGGRLLPLFLLVVSRLLALVLSLTVFQPDRPLTVGGMGALEVFSTFCIVWILLRFALRPAGSWPRLVMWSGAGAAILSALPLTPVWPIPPVIHSLVIAIFSPVILRVSLGRVHWTTLAPPLIIALASFVALFGLITLSWFIALFAYAFLVYAIHREIVQSYQRIYADRQQTIEELVQEAIAANQEQQRWLEASKTISDVSNIHQALEHIAKTMTRLVGADQAAIVVLDVKENNLGRLVTFYSPERSFYISDEDEIEFALNEYPTLKSAIESRKQVMLLQPRLNGLTKLYGLWYEERIGPTLIQPLSTQGQPVGALVLGNPLSRRPIDENDARLCNMLSGQIAAIVEFRRRYLELQTEMQAMAAGLRETKGQTASIKSSQAVSGMLASFDRMAEVEAYLAILRSINDGVVMSDNLGRVRWVNPAAESILGQSAVELIGQPIARIYGEIASHEPIEDLMVAFSRRNQPLPTFIETEERAIQGRLIPWRNEQHEWMGIIAVFRDVTREVKADQSRNDFIAALSRELRAPLTTIKGYSELILNGDIEKYTPEQLQVQRIIHSNSEKMEQVLDNAIKITAQNRHQILPRFEDVDLQKIVRQALREIASLAELRELDLHSEIQADLPLITADSRHLRRILDNLLSNACRFTPPGGHVTVRAWLTEAREGNTFHPRVQITVADTGIGIPPTETRRIFDPFYRIDSPSFNDDTGMGLGLTVVKDLVQLHHGQVWVESTPGQGAVFHVMLPVTQEL